MRARYIFLLPWLLFGAAAVAGERPQDYATRVELDLSGDGPWYRLELPMALQMAARHGDLRDLRVFNAQGQMLAYSLRSGRQQYQQTRSETEVPRFPLTGAGAEPSDAQLRIRRDAQGTLIEVLPAADAAVAAQQLRGWLLDTSAIDGVLERLILDWSAEQEGFQRLSIEASDDLQNWRARGEAQLARISFDGAQVEQNEVDLRGISARYLRLLWPAGQSAARLERVRLVSSRNDRAVPMVWSHALVPIRLGNDEYRWELPLSLPLDRVRIELAETGTLAPVMLAGRSESSQRWRPLRHGLLYRLEQGGVASVQDQLQLDGHAVRQLSVRVDPRGGGLGEAPRMYAGMHATQVVFLARGEAPYSLALGRGDATSAALPLGTLIPAYDDSQLATLGSAQMVKGELVPEPATADERSAIDSKRYGLWAVLLVGVALLLLMSLSLLRKPGQAPEA